MTERKLALITGASSGIGAAFARHAAAAGHDVVLAARRMDRLEALATEIRIGHAVEAIVLAADLADPQTPGRMMDSLRARGRAVDILVNNAGFSIPQGFAWSPLAAQRAFLEVTVGAPVALCHHVLGPMLEKRWGRILNIASIAALSTGGKGHTLYPAGKSFLIKFSRSVHTETKDYGVHVSAVCPGFVKTGFHKANNTEDRIGKTPDFLWQSPEEIVREAWRRNDRGAEVIVPGLLPKLVAGMLHYGPEFIVSPLTRRAAADHYVGDG